MKRLAVLMTIILLPLLCACVELTPERSVSIAATVAFTEGPTVAKDGTVYFTDLYSNPIGPLAGKSAPKTP